MTHVSSEKIHYAYDRYAASKYPDLVTTFIDSEGEINKATHIGNSVADVLEKNTERAYAGFAYRKSTQLTPKSM